MTLVQLEVVSISHASRTLTTRKADNEDPVKTVITTPRMGAVVVNTAEHVSADTAKIESPTRHCSKWVNFWTAPPTKDRRRGTPSPAQIV